MAHPHWSLDDTLLAESIPGFDLSPDGKRLVWEKTTWDSDRQRSRTHLYISNTAEGPNERQLTRGEDACFGARWSPDGKKVAFLTSRRAPDSKEDTQQQVWVLDADGGDPYPVTSYPRGVRGFTWRGADKVVFRAQEERTWREAWLSERKDDSRDVDDEDHEPPVRLFEQKLGNGKARRLTQNDDRIARVSISRDGAWALALHEQSLSFGYDNRIRPVLRLWNLTEGTYEDLFHGKFTVSGYRWFADSERFLVIEYHASRERYVTAGIRRAWLCDIAGRAEPLDLGSRRGLAYQDPVATGEGCLAVTNDGAWSGLFLAQGEPLTLTDIGGEHVRHLFGLRSALECNTIAYVSSSMERPPQLYVAELEEGKLTNPRQISKINSGWEDKPKAKGEVVSWVGALGEMVEGVLTYPTGYEEGKRYPLILSIHGGPHGHDRDGWGDNIYDPLQMLSERGAFVLQPNYHGSDGYGLAWSESIRDGGYYSLPLEDIERGVDAMIERGLADPDRLATMGWSNGAIYSIALVTRSERFKACSCGAGGAEWVADWGACDFGLSFSNYYFGASPLEEPELYRENAPLYEFEKVTTPTLFLHGTDDSAVPTHHSWVQFRALQQLGKAQTKLVLFPGEPHGLRLLSHRRRKLEVELAWLDHHLFGKPTPEPWKEALKDGSHLDRLMKLTKVAKDESGAYGALVEGVLTPEFVRHKGIELARFEVTVAQWNAFRAEKAGRPNRPVIVAAEEAQEYCAWLGERLGRAVRLPNAEEADKLYGGNGSGENTLDRWAGYKVTPTDLAKLREAIASAGVGPEELLWDVGSGPGQGDPAVYDLAGNVSEWTVAADGPTPRGRSAVQPADIRVPCDPDLAYTGFRVVMEPATG